MIRWEFKFSITEFHLIFALILISHLSILGMTSEQDPYVASLKQEQQSKIKVQLEKNRKESEKELLEAIAGNRFKRVPYVVTYLGDVKLKRHSELLNLLQMKSHFKQVKVSGFSGLVTQEQEEISNEQKELVDFDLTITQKKNLIKRLIKERMKGVEICKKKHLLQDEFLLGTIKVDMKIKSQQNLAVSRFKGHGNRNVIQSLESCVSGQLVSMSFPYELTNEEVMFDVKIN